MKVRRPRNVFRDLRFPPAEAENLGTRAALMIKISEHIQRNGLTTEKATKTLGVTKLNIRDLMRGRIEMFSIEALTGMQKCIKKSNV